MASDFIPNSYQTPNVYVDKYMHLLTDPEWKVLSYAVRRIFGFHKREDCISLSQFATGTVSDEGEQLDYGTGLSEPTIAKCLTSLAELNLMRLVAENDPRTNNGARWALQLNDSRVNHAELARRQAAWQERNQVRMAKVRAKKTPKQPETAGKSDLPTPVNDIYRTPQMPFTNNILVENQIMRVAENPQAPVQQVTLFEQPSEPKVKGKRGAKPKEERTPEYLDYLARKKAIEAAYIECIGYTPVTFGEAARASKQLAEAGYDASHVRGCWKHMMQDTCWHDQHTAGRPIKLTSIASAIPAWWQAEKTRLERREREAAQQEAARQQREQARQSQNARILSPEEQAALVRELRQNRRMTVAAMPA